MIHAASSKTQTSKEAASRTARGAKAKEALGELCRIDPAVKAIVSTGCSDAAMETDFRDDGFCAALPKPYQMGDLSHVLREVLGDGALTTADSQSTG
ncbi:MAG: hypothetical protein MUF54_12725 [Polyangiaceae bacterium]|jgi:DNA-binding NtrC family response regulator|nr:hypothetical protein [Polyangiaceae bacterium]